MREIFPGCYAMGMDEFISRAAMLPTDSDHIADILEVQPMPGPTPDPRLTNLCPDCSRGLSDELCPGRYIKCPILP